jgi:hypothetical protein
MELQSPLLASPPQSDLTALPNGHGKNGPAFIKGQGLGGPLTLFASINDQLRWFWSPRFKPGCKTDTRKRGLSAGMEKGASSRFEVSDPFILGVGSCDRRFHTRVILSFLCLVWYTE